jgi:hypothetical protein
MVQLYGRSWTRKELGSYTGSAPQLGGVRTVELTDGIGRNVRVAEFDTGTGWKFDVLLDRAMDIGATSYQGIPLAWNSCNGVPHPAYYDKDGLEFLRTFVGGLMCTCGMTYVGAPCVDEGNELGLHGRVAHLPASNIWVDGGWRGDEYEMWARGKVRETVLYGENLLLSRRISANLGESKLVIRDTVANEGYQTTPHMILYHCNFGFPLLDQGAELVAPSKVVAPRDAVAAPDVDRHHLYAGPTAGYVEQCYYHDMATDEEGFVTAMLVNRALLGGQGLGAYVRYRKAELPRFIQWKMVGVGTYVTGLEPANCLVEGRDKDRARGILQFLEPGEQREYVVELGVVAGAEAIAALTRKIKG